ncbi:MAG: RNA polymerase sigma factor [Eubacteriales bacterium]|nr:RNA polymerase sigma factor [Eubacteriales bacterium]
MSMDPEEQYDKIYRYCWFHLHQRELAEDITQETFLRFYAQTSYRESGKAIRYLYTIARNLCIDAYRAPSAEPLSESLEQPDPSDETLTRIGIQRALSQLTQEEQELLLLRYVNELSVSDLCDLLGVSRFAVYRKTRQALKKLRNILGEEDFS